jgi:hypothetical protein
MLASFRETFHPTDEDRATRTAMLRRFHEIGVAGKHCEYCKKATWIPELEMGYETAYCYCSVNGEFVERIVGRDCFEEKPFERKEAE